MIAMVLVIDVGNTNIVLGVYREDELVYHWRLTTDQEKTEDEYGMTVKALLENAGLALLHIDGAIISSVVPPIMFSLEHMCRKYLGLEPMVIGPGMKTGLNIRYDSPRDVGADRIVNAVAALDDYEPPLVIVDFGTATTFCYIDEHGQYIGGAIAPGIAISTEALYSEASKLPRIEIAAPYTIVGKNTVHAMQSGIYYGYVGQVDGIVSRMKKQAPAPATSIATGGLARLIGEEAETIDIVDPSLTLKGLKIIYDKNVSGD
ncbi:type III pantothenate kinase [Salsuginibacillus halophilus]|uniref:Type III pantothenate kinase n=2 Tax=Salsuginibacillus halophilus TaxID=517424 RepID=A0A2P8H7U7_9BACI|nr:type III pantothenate kinase [Salsuginibacillus halophilus]